MYTIIEMSTSFRVQSNKYSIKLNVACLVLATKWSQMAKIYIRTQNKLVLLAMQPSHKIILQRIIQFLCREIEGQCTLMASYQLTPVVVLLNSIYCRSNFRAHVFLDCNRTEIQVDKQIALDLTTSLCRAIWLKSLYRVTLRKIFGIFVTTGPPTRSLHLQWLQYVEVEAT